MNKSKIILSIGILVVIVLGATIFFSRGGVKLAGGAGSSYTDSTIQAGGGFQAGTGSTVSNWLFGKCNPTFYGTSLAATSTGTFVCSVSGVMASDTIIPDAAANSAVVSPGFIIENAYSTTTGIVAFTILNLSGAATTSFAQATTGIEYWDIR